MPPKQKKLLRSVSRQSFDDVAREDRANSSSPSSAWQPSAAMPTREIPLIGRSRLSILGRRYVCGPSADWWDVPSIRADENIQDTCSGAVQMGTLIACKLIGLIFCLYFQYAGCLFFESIFGQRWYIFLFYILKTFITHNTPNNTIQKQHTIKISSVACLAEPGRRQHSQQFDIVPALGRSKRCLPRQKSWGLLPRRSCLLQTCPHLCTLNV